MYKYSVVIMCLLQVACGSSSEEKAKTILEERGSFYDPFSVQVKNITHNDAETTFCGEVNAKNRLGGYTGWKRFVILDADNTDASVYVEGAGGDSGLMDRAVLDTASVLCGL